MKNALVIVGNEINQNIYFVEYLKRELKSHFKRINGCYLIDRNDSDLLLYIEDIVSKYKRVLIVSKDAHHLIGKILSTITEDNLTLIDDELIPSRYLKKERDSYLIEYKSSLINAMKVDQFEKLPKIIVDDSSKEISFMLIDANSPKYDELLLEMEKIYSLKLYKCELIEGVELIRATGFLLEQEDSFKKALAFGFSGKILFGDDLSYIVAKRLIKSGKKVTTMESCTGGLIASELTKHSGVSSVFDGSIVSYANEIKNSFGVSKDTLMEYGAVSLQTVNEMLDGIMNFMRSDFAIAVSGVAGPGGGSKEKPVGTVYVGAKSRDGETIIEKLSLKGDRIYIQQQSMLWAFKLLVLSNPKIFFNFSLNSLDN